MVPSTSSTLRGLDRAALLARGRGRARSGPLLPGEQAGAGGRVREGQEDDEEEPPARGGGVAARGDAVGEGAGEGRRERRGRDEDAAAGAELPPNVVEGEGIGHARAEARLGRRQEPAACYQALPVEPGGLEYGAWRLPPR